ncbi:hypothetical protein KFJ24_06685 [Marinobacter sediminum]|uniref:hypothetical protein n=1 Tax=Marinobacter sediminum TaxID=256323 RepID=UPI00202E483B|nr:hypothetical protein [Marinobacter sediminum]MCM0612162.1 hypothetical protein [Marinobacter sediminum]
MDWNKIKKKTSASISEVKGKAHAITQHIKDSDAAAKSREFGVEVTKKLTSAVDEFSTGDALDKAATTSRQIALGGKKAVVGATDWTYKKYAAMNEPTNEKNWYLRMAQACEDTSDAVLRNESGASSKISKGVASKVGAASATAGIFSVASLLGTAGTGTAIGSLSGAAFTSAALAWVGGSVLVGSLVITVAAIAGGIGAAIGVTWASKRFVYGEKRQRSELEEQERRIVDACLALAVAFREKNKITHAIDPVSAKHLYGEALMPLCKELVDVQTKVNSWPYMARQRLNSAINKIKNASGYLQEWSTRQSNVSTGVVSAVLVRLLANDIDSFNDNEKLVLAAMRRSNSDLTEASPEELATYVQSLEPSQLPGLTNNVKGIYHEIRFAHEENNDGDEYVVELFDATNHQGADVVITNLTTGEVNEVQLKATNYLSLIREHNEKYESTHVFATEEVASTSSDIESTGFTNEQLTNDVDGVIDDLDNYSGSGIVSSMAVAGMVTLARNVRVLLKEDQLSQKEKEKLVSDGAISAGVAGVVSLLLG